MTAEQDFEEQVQNAVKDFGRPPRIILCGKTGAGKSSLINALLQRKIQEVDVVPCTAEVAEVDWNAGLADIKLIDVPGFGEAGKHAKWLEQMHGLLSEADIALLVIGAPDRALESERQFLEDVRSVDLGEDVEFPVIVVGNKIDLINPVREWTPLELNLSDPSTTKERNITEWFGEVRRATNATADVRSLVAAGESWNDSGGQYGLTELRNKILAALPDAAQNYAARAFAIEEFKQARAEKIIWGSSVLAGTFALIPVPLADAIPITAIQVTMIVSIALVYGLRLDARQAVGLLGPTLAALAGPLAVRELVKFIPGFGGAVGAGVAAVATWAIGMTYLHFFMAGNFEPSVDEVKELLRTKFQEGKNLKEQLKAEAEQKAKEGKR